MDYSHLLDTNDAAKKSLSVAHFLEKINQNLSGEKYRIQGEVTSINKSYGKAIYFSIKDSEKDAKLDCVIWKGVYDQNGVNVEVGDEIIITGTPEIYAPQGRFSLKVSTLEYAGEGALKKAYDQLKEKLTQEGIFDRERKKLPKYPKKIGVITSLKGVVIHDFTTNLERRGYELVVIDSRVEGKDAIHDLGASLRTFEKKDIDLLVIMRGGGSWESLQAFNTESVVRMIAEFPIPVLTGIGHDVDVTLSELVADKGASTPTAVAKTINEPWKILQRWLQGAETKTFSRLEQEIISKKRDVETAEGKIIKQYGQTLRNSEVSLEKDLRKINRNFQNLNKQADIFQSYFRKISQMTNQNLDSIKQSIDTYSKSTSSYIQHSQEATRKNLNFQGKTIELYNPESSLKRGYSILYQNNKIVRSIKDISIGGSISTQIADGKIDSSITHITP